MLRLRAADGAAAVLPSVLLVGVPVPSLARTSRPVNAVETTAAALLKDMLGAIEIPPDYCTRCGLDYLPDGTCRRCDRDATP
jgi:hypothetical protein